MPKHYQPIIQQPITDFFKFKAGDTLSPFVNEGIQLQYPAMPLMEPPKTGVVTVSGYLTITLSKPFMLTGLLYHAIKDAACDTASGQKLINAQVKGTTKAILYWSMLSLTAQDLLINIQFKTPIILDAGGVSNNITYAAGNMIRTLTLFGFEL